MEDNYLKQTIHRKIPLSVRIIHIMLYISVVIFSVFGAMWGAFWLVPSLGTLILAWYFMGSARVSYFYRLDGTRLHVQRASGFKARPKVKAFVEAEISEMVLLTPEDSSFAREMDEKTKDANPKRITYDISAHDPAMVCDVMFVPGVEAENGRMLKVYCQLSPALKESIREIKPDAVKGYE